MAASFGLIVPTTNTVNEAEWKHCRSTYVPEAEGMVISCTDFPPRATFWHALRSAGIEDRIKGCGRLLELH